MQTVEMAGNKIHPPLLPGLGDFLLCSVEWWEAKVYRAIRLLR